MLKKCFSNNKMETQKRNHMSCSYRLNRLGTYINLLEIDLRDKRNQS